jgi:hypothetical protein
MFRFRQLRMDRVRIVAGVTIKSLLNRLSLPTERLTLAGSSHTKTFTTIRPEMVPTRGKRWCSSVVRYFPKDFHVEDKWAFLDIVNVKPEARCIEKSDLAALTAARCMNARGAISHGQETELSFSIEDMKNCRDVQAAFDTFGGTKRLTSINAIKEELMENGPVVSTSFIPTQEFISTSRYVNKSSLHASCLGKKHEIIIVGWKSMDFGEVWLARPLRSSRMDSILIRFGHYGVDDLCLAPKNSFENRPWQKGPYIDMDVTELSKDWMDYNSVYLSYFDEANTLRGSGSFVRGYWSNSYVVIRDKDKIAHSRRFSVMEIKLNNEKSRLEMLAVKVWLNRVPMFIWRWVERNGDWLPFFECSGRMR